MQAPNAHASHARQAWMAPLRMHLKNAWDSKFALERPHRQSYSGFVHSTRSREMDMEVKTKPLVSASLAYLVPGAEKPYNLMYQPDDGSATTNCTYVSASCFIQDGRQAEPAPALDLHGFQLVNAPSAVSDFYEDTEVRTRYFEEVCALVQRMTGSKRVRIFDHQRRQREEGRPALGFGRHGDGKSPAAVGRVHNDYSEASGLKRLALEMPDVASNANFMILNLWRPLLHPAIDTPLAVCDARTVRAEDWVAADLIYQERKGELYLSRFSSRHQWYYYPAMDVNEVLVFKTFDSRRDQVARMVPHVAFDDPTTPSDAPLRRSLEVRCLVLLDEEGEA
jgi:hypothetical protein